MENDKWVFLLSSPLSIAVIGWWIKGQLNKIDKISEIIVKIDNLKERILELKIMVEKFDQTKEDVILLKRDVSTQWKRYDELTKRVDGVLTQ